MGATGTEMPFRNSIIDNFMVYQNRNETNLSQLSANTENSEWFSMISIIILEVNNVSEQK